MSSFLDIFFFFFTTIKMTQGSPPIGTSELLFLGPQQKFQIAASRTSDNGLVAMGDFPLLLKAKYLDFNFLRIVSAISIKIIKNLLKIILKFVKIKKL